MIRTLINEMLGPLGRQLLAFYSEYSLVINGLVVLYGLVILLAHQNYLRMVAYAARRMAESSPGVPLTWETVIAEASRFPWVAQRFSLLPRRATAETMEAYLPMQALAEGDEKGRRQVG